MGVTVQRTEGVAERENKNYYRETYMFDFLLFLERSQPPTEKLFI